MTDLRTDLGEAVATAFAAEGVEASVARVTASDLPTWPISSPTGLWPPPRR